MEKKNAYRHELKYQINYAEYLAIRQRIRHLLKADKFVREDGRYLIRSIYFDNADDKALREKKDGVKNREKFRIRYYNDDFSYIALEKKVKNNNLCLKTKAVISKEECNMLLDGKITQLREHENETVRELCHKMVSQQLRPRVVVSYVREPYVYQAGNVRITFDSDIRTSLFHRDFLDDEMHDVSVADVPGQIVLEIKYDAFIPEVVADLVQTEGIRQQAYSKYGASRRFG